MGAIRKKISELNPSTAFNGLWTIGVDALNRSVRVSLQYIADTIASLKSGVETAINNADKATDRANTAATNADNARIKIEANEQERIDNEQRRLTAEQTREANEQERIDNEQRRLTAEQTREANEQERIKAENNRANNERSRIEAESRRVETHGVRMKEAENAITNATEAADFCREVAEQIQGTLGHIPVALEYDAPQYITFGNRHEFAINARLLPEQTAQNILFLGDDGAVSVAPDGKLTVNHTGESVIHIIPVARVELFKTVRIRVAEPTVGLTGDKCIRLTGSGDILLR